MLVLLSQPFNLLYLTVFLAQSLTDSTTPICTLDRSLALKPQGSTNPLVLPLWPSGPSLRSGKFISGLSGGVHVMDFRNMPGICNRLERGDIQPPCQ